MNEITGIIVSYNTRILLKNCVDSIRKFCPEMKLIIIDGSNIKDRCHGYAKSLINGNTKVLSETQNIGHGDGMSLGIRICDTKYFVLIDSDTVMRFNPLPSMKDVIKNNYGVGQVVRVNELGMNQENGIKYLHPHFALINKDQYLKFAKIIHHGAPMLSAMIDLNNKKKSELLINFTVEKYIHHLGRGTRVSNPKEFHPKYWDKVYL